MIKQEVKTSGLSYEKVWQKMERNLSTMKSAVEEGVEGVESTTGLTGGDAFKMKRYIDSGRGLSGDVPLHAICYAVSTNEVNAAMGHIFATPTRGSAGVDPGVYFAMKENHPEFTVDEMDKFIFT